MKEPRDVRVQPAVDRVESEAAEAIRVILARRAQYMALAMVAVGAAASSCGGDVDSGQNVAGAAGRTTTGTIPSQGGVHPCLSIASTSWNSGGAVASSGGSEGSGGVASTGSATTALGGSGGMTVCLSVLGGSATRGGMGPCLSPPAAS